MPRDYAASFLCRPPSTLAQPMEVAPLGAHLLALSPSRMLCRSWKRVCTLLLKTARL